MTDPQLPADLLLFERQLQKNLGGVFAPARPIFLARAPGRLDILGGICEVAGAAVLQQPLADAVIVAVQPRIDRRILIRNLNLNKERVLTIEHRMDDLLDAAQQGEWAALRALALPVDRGWTARILAALSLLLARRPNAASANGLNVAIQSTLPAGAGLGSSAALIVALLLALTEVYAIPLEDGELADIGEKVESQVLRLGCGRAEYLTILLGRQQRITMLQGQLNGIKPDLSLPQGAMVLAIDTGVRKTAGCQKMNELCAALWIGRTLLQEALASDEHVLPLAGYLGGIPRDDWHSGVKKLVPYRCSGQEFLRQHPEEAQAAAFLDPEKKYMPRTILEYVVEEGERVQALSQMLEQATAAPDENNLDAAGALLYASHRQYSKVSGAVCAEADWLVDALQAMGPAAGIYGARAMPGGTGSSVLVLAKTACADQLHNLVSRYLSYSGKNATIYTGSSEGAKVIGVVPARFEG